MLFQIDIKLIVIKDRTLKTFESNVILDRYKTQELTIEALDTFESNVILDRYKTLQVYNCIKLSV